MTRFGSASRGSCGRSGSVNGTSRVDSQKAVPVIHKDASPDLPFLFVVTARSADAGARTGKSEVDGSDPPFCCPERARGCCAIHICATPPGGVAPVSIIPSGRTKMTPVVWQVAARVGFGSPPVLVGSGAGVILEGSSARRSPGTWVTREDKAAMKAAEVQRIADLSVSIPLGVAWATLRAVRRPSWLMRRTWNGACRTGLRISVAGVESGPTTPALGFTEPALRVSVSNTGKRTVRVTDLRLMFSEPFGLPVLPEAPGGRSHPKLPVRIPTAEEVVWYFPAQAASRSLNELFMPSHRTGHRVVAVYVRCCFSSGAVGVSRLVRIPTDQETHWPSPPAI